MISGLAPLRLAQLARTCNPCHLAGPSPLPLGLHLLRKLSSLASSPSEEPKSSPKFAVAFSQATALSLAVAECVESVQRQLQGVQPDLLCLLATNDLHHRYMSLAPAFAFEPFVGPDLKPPVLMGGAVESVFSLAGPTPAVGSGVSLLAASLPGVRLYPFHALTSSVPSFSPEQWQALLRKPLTPAPELLSHHGSASTPSTGSGLLAPTAPDNLCGLVFCEPHFVEVEKFLGRLHGLLPHCTLLGGVTQPDNISSRSHTPGMMASVLPGHGAVFMGRECHPTGAVGCLMQGPIELRTRVASACRPVGPVMEVTESRGNTVLQLDGIPAMLALRQAMEVISSKSQANVVELPLEVGIDFSGKGLGYLARGLGQANPALGSVQLMVSEVPRGALIQLHLLDTRWGAIQYKQHLGALLRPASAAPHPFPTLSTVAPSIAAAAGAETAAGQAPRGAPTADPAATAAPAAAQVPLPTPSGVSPAVKGSRGQVLGPGGILDRGRAPSAPAAASELLLNFSCTTVANDEPWALRDLLGPGGVAEGRQVVLQGGKVQGELAPGPGTNDPALYSFTSVMGVLRGV